MATIEQQPLREQKEHVQVVEEVIITDPVTGRRTITRKTYHPGGQATTVELKML